MSKYWFKKSSTKQFFKLLLSIMWDSVNLITPIGRRPDGYVRPFENGDSFQGILISKNIKNLENENADNSIEVAYLQSGKFYNVIVKNNVALGDYLKVVPGGFTTTADKSEAVGVVVDLLDDNGASESVVQIRGGNY